MAGVGVAGRQFLHVFRFGNVYVHIDLLHLELEVPGEKEIAGGGVHIDERRLFHQRRHVHQHLLIGQTQRVFNRLGVNVL